MYGFIWRKLPFGIPGKIGGMLILLGGIGALLWFFAFPRLEPLLPFDDSQISDAPTEEMDPNNQIPDEEPSDPPLPEDEEGDGGGSGGGDLLPGG
ncbi:hypothetical protein AB0I28_39040 [Phytomonospora sp. NPDC050363]|uniref:hypothetical protein n=1 Tax=Phytomonospora sp. NPDC050363 TaxID=3155642 RepID=UPI003401E31C